MNSIKNSEHFGLYSNNCSKVVVRVLQAGGYTARGCIGVYYNKSIIWTPIKLIKFVKESGGVRRQWSDLAGELKDHEIDINEGRTEETLAYNAKPLVTEARDGRYCDSGAQCKFHDDKAYGEGRSKLAELLW